MSGKEKHLHEASDMFRSASQTGAWTPEEDAILAAMQAELGNRWSAVAQHIPGRTGQQCAQRWRHKVNPNIRKEKWTEEEDRHLEALVKEYGFRWAEIARRCEGRTDQQCMGRWRRHLDPDIRRDSWRPAEDAQLKKLHKQYGSQWSLISKQIEGRTAQQCRARFFQIHHAEDSPAKPKGAYKRRSSSSGFKARTHKKQYVSDSSDTDTELDSALTTPEKTVPDRSTRMTRQRHSIPHKPTSKQSSGSSWHNNPSQAASMGHAKKSVHETNGGASGSSGEEHSSMPPRMPSLDFVTPKKVQLADSAKNTSPSKVQLPTTLASLSPQQQLALSPFLAQLCSPLAGMSQRLTPSPLHQSFAAQWRLSPTVFDSPGRQLVATGGTPILFSTECMTPLTMSTPPKDRAKAFGEIAVPVAHAATPNDRLQWSEEILKSAGKSSLPNGTLSYRGRLGESVKRKLSLVPTANEDEETEQEKGECAFSTPPKRPKALVLPTTVAESKEAAACSTPVQLQQVATHAGRPSLTPLSSLATVATDEAAPKPDPEEGAVDKENSQPAPAVVQLPRPAVHPKKQLIRRAGEGVAGSRSRLNALLGFE
eukprot:scaffold109615_cov50-Prasinocladus_malaysianus.AAC.3